MSRVLPGVSCLLSTLMMAPAVLAAQGERSVAPEIARQWGEATQGQTISLTTDKATFSPGESIVLSISLKVVGTESVRVTGGTPLACYKFTMVGPRGKPTPMTLYGRKMLASSMEASRNFALEEPGFERSASIHLSRLYDMSLSGKYVISVRKSVFRKGTKEILSVVSNTVTVTVEND